MKKSIILSIVFLMFMSSCSAKLKIDRYEHVQTIFINNPNIQAYSKPFCDQDKYLIYTSKENDIINTEFVLYSEETKQTCLEVILPSGEKGYINLESNPYRDNLFSVIETYDINGKQVKALNYLLNPLLESISGVTRNIYKLPDESSEVVYTLVESFRVDATRITDDYKWIYVVSESFSGWAKIEYISCNIGGPKYYTAHGSIESQLNEEGEA